MFLGRLAAESKTECLHTDKECWHAGFDAALELHCVAMCSLYPLVGAVSHHKVTPAGKRGGYGNFFLQLLS